MQQRKPDIIKQPIPLILGTFAVAVALLVARAVRAPLPCEAEVAGVLSSVGVWFDGLFSPLWSVVFAVLMTVASAVVFTRIISRYSISVIRSLIPLVLYCLLVCGVSYPVGSPSLGLALFLLAHSAELMVGSFRRKAMFDDVMCGSFYAGLAALLVPDFVWASLLVAYQWSLYRRSARECVAGGVMWLLPIVPAEFVSWVVGGKVGLVVGEWAEGLSLPSVFSVNDVVQQCGGVFGGVLVGVCLLLGVVCLVAFVAAYGSMRIRARKIHLYFSALFLVGVAMLLLGFPVVVALPIVGMGAVPLVHTFFVRVPGVWSVTIYIGMLLAVLWRSFVG